MTTNTKAAATLSAVIEAGDKFGQSLVAKLGINEACNWITNQDPTDPFSTNDSTGSEPWKQAHRRYQDRLSNLDIQGELDALEELGGYLVTADSPQWPTTLDVLAETAPYALWVRGNLPATNQLTIGITGARAATHYAHRIAEDFAQTLTKSGHAIITGGGYGVDAAAIKGALTNPNNDCPTVAVLAGGLQNMYPYGNHHIFEDILAANGAIISEQPPSYQPARWRFLERNRIIAALAAQTTIVEGGLRTGAMVTANRAHALNRPVGAIPGPITSPASAGPNQLIKDGTAKLVTSAADIMAMI